MQANMRTVATSAQTKVARPQAVARPQRAVMTAAVDSNRSNQAFAAAAAALMLVASPVGAMQIDSPNPQATVADNPLAGLFRFSKAKGERVKEDPFGADKFQANTIGETKKSMPIITEQEAVIPEAFPNPAGGIFPKPPVLASAEGDEQYGCNANQFAGVDESCRQGLIDKKSPAESSSN